MAAAPARTQDVQPSPSPTTAISIIELIEQCAFNNQELFVPALKCIERYGADREIRASREPYVRQLPYKQDGDKVCSDPQYEKQILNGNIIKRFVNEAKKKVGAAGIRIIGAIFCEELDLAGLELQYSLVIDRSVFKDGIDARNLRVMGDLSLDNGIVFESFDLRRGRIEGTFWGRWAFFEHVDFSDIEIRGAARFSGSVFLTHASFAGATISRDLDLSQTAMSRFTLASGQVKGELNLSYSEARCAYVMRATEIGRVTAHNAGFGKIRSDIDRLWWSRALATGVSQHIFASPAVVARLDTFTERVKHKQPLVSVRRGTQRDTQCEDATSAGQLRFVVIDSVI